MMKIKIKQIAKSILIAATFFSVVFIQGCMKDDGAVISEQERFLQELTRIDSYLEENNIEAEIDPITGVRYVIHSEGTGIMPYVVDSVTISSTEKLLVDGRVYQSYNNEKLGWRELVSGIKISLSKIREGGSVTAYIPSFYGYGQVEMNDIPANSILIAEMDLHEVNAQQLKKDIKAIDDSLSAWGITASKHPTGIRYVLEQGTGDSPTVNSRVTVKYAGMLLGKETKFDSGLNSTFPLGNLIPAWQIILPLVKVGGSVTMYIPSSLGYGKQGSPPTIPANANLVFEVDLLDVN